MNSKEDSKDIENYYKHIVDRIPSAIIVYKVIDGILHVHYLSDFCVTITGFTPEELYQHVEKDPAYDIYPDDKKKYLEGIRNVDQQIIDFVFRFIRKDGQTKWLKIRLSREDNDGNVMFYGLFSDFDEQHKLEVLQHKIESEKEKEKMLLNSIPGGIAKYHVMNDGTIRISYVSERLANLLGYKAEEFIEKYGNDSKECVFEEDRKIIGVAIQNMIKTHEPISNHYRCYKKNGDLITVSFDGNIVETNNKMDGEIISIYAVQAIFSDEHEKLIHEQEISLSLINNMPGGIGIYDIYKGVASLSFLNNSYLQMMDLKREDREQYYGHDILAVVHPEDRHVLYEMIENVYNGDRKANLIFRVRTGKETWKWINLLMRVIEVKDEHYTIFGNLNDYDEVIKVQQEMDAAHKKEETLLSSIPGGIGIYHIKKNGQATTEYISESLARMCGFEADEFLEYIKDDCLIGTVPEDIPLVRATFAKALQDNKPVSVIYHIFKKDKSKILIRLDATLIQTTQLAPDERAVFYAVHTLVSEESRLIIEEQKTLKTILNRVPAGIGIYIVDNGILSQEYMNDAFFEILHTSREKANAFSGSNAIKAVHKDDISKIREAIIRLENGETHLQCDYRVVNHSKDYIWFHTSVSVLERKEGFLRLLIAFFDFSENKRQELILLQNQHAVALAQLHGDISIWTYNIDKKCIEQQYVDSSVGHMGYHSLIENVPEIFLTTNSIYSEDIEIFKQAYKDLSDGKETTDVTYRLYNRATNKFSWVRMFYQRMEDSIDGDRMAVGFSMNVDKQQESIERYKVEKELRKRMYENVLMYIEYNLTKDCFESDVVGGDGSYEQKIWSGTTLDDYKKSLLNTIEEKYVDEVSEKLFSKSLLKAFSLGETKIFVEYRTCARPNKPSRWIRTAASLVKRPDTGDVMAFIYVEDIEKSKQKQLAIELSLDDGIESIALINVDDRKVSLIRNSNEKTKHLINTEFIYNDDFVDRSHKIVVPEDQDLSYKSALFENIIKELKTKSVFEYSIGIVNRKSDFKRQLFRFRYLDDRKKTIVMSISNITSIYMIEQEKKKTLENTLSALKKASSAKADFYSRMSHDMRTPMNGILGMTELSNDEKDINVLHRNIEKIHDSGKYLLKLINDTLDIQRIESGKLKLELQVIYAAKAVESILEMVKPLADAKGLNLEFDKGNTDTNWYVRTDPVRIKQIFVNLISNAIKFTPSGGTVKFTSKLIKREGMISHDVFTISDTGIGMSEDFLQHGIFQPFSQENNQVTANYAGSGLGLSIVKSLVELMGGHIEVESELGVGTTFTIYLDLERVAEKDANHFFEAKKNPNINYKKILKDRKILLIEDHPLNAEIAKKLLTNVGCIVTWANNGKIGLEKFKESKDGFFDAILMDIRMPVMDGLEATRQIRALNKVSAKTVPIIAMTANAYEDDIKKSKEAGMNVHLGKPIEAQKLFETLAFEIGEINAK